VADQAGWEAEPAVRWGSVTLWGGRSVGVWLHCTAARAWPDVQAGQRRECGALALGQGRGVGGPVGWERQLGVAGPGRGVHRGAGPGRGGWF